MLRKYIPYCSWAVNISARTEERYESMPRKEVHGTVEMREFVPLFRASLAMYSRERYSQVVRLT
jgi:hypothetical protein